MQLPFRFFPSFFRFISQFLPFFFPFFIGKKPIFSGKKNASTAYKEPPRQPIRKAFLYIVDGHPAGQPGFEPQSVHLPLVFFFRVFRGFFRFYAVFLRFFSSFFRVFCGFLLKKKLSRRFIRTRRDVI